VMQTLVAFAVVCLLLAMVPGPGAMVILRQAIRDGRGPAAMTLLGNETALIIWGCAAASGLTALITASRVAYDMMRLTGAVVLVVLGVQAVVQARRQGVQDVPESVESGRPVRRHRAWRSYSVGLLANLTNPKAAVFALSFLPRFARPGYPLLPMLVGLSVLWAVVDALWFLLVIWFIARAKAFLTWASVWRRLARLSGIVLIGLGFRPALESR
jgi:threonine/homoserine/homoserine lactone efflux protein